MIRTHADELAEIETRDNGRIIVETTLFDLPACTEMLYYFAGAADKISGDTVQIGPGPASTSRCGSRSGSSG